MQIHLLLSKTLLTFTCLCSTPLILLTSRYYAATKSCIAGPSPRPWEFPRTTLAVSSARSGSSVALPGTTVEKDVVKSVSAEACDDRPGRLTTHDSIVSVAGQSFRLPSFASSDLSQSLKYVLAYQQSLAGTVNTSLSDFPSVLDLGARLASLREFFAPARAEADALADAAGFQWSDAILNRDRDLLRLLGSLDKVIDHHADHHKLTGLNPDRVNDWLRDDPYFATLLEIASSGGEVDVDDDFVPFHRTTPLRNLQKRLLPVYRKHAHKMWSSNRGLLFRLSDLDDDTLASLHTGNDCHWTTKPACAAGRFLIDCSNGPPGTVPLNGGTAKDKGIARYQKVSLPSLLDVIRKWDVYRRKHGLSWWDMIMFKEDVTGAFNQLNWSGRSAKYLCAMVDDDIVFVMLTGGFGHCVTPMIWSLVGDAITRLVREKARCPVDMFVDDTFGAGLPIHVREAASLTRENTTRVLGPDSIACDKSAIGPKQDILGFAINFLSASLLPKDVAIEKIFFVFFNIDTRVPQPLVVWQCLASIAQFYSPGIRGMTAFVAPLHHMTRKCTGSLRICKATPAAQFVIEVWRVMAILLMVDRQSVSVSLDSFILGPDSPCDFNIVSDASPWRLAAAIYHPESRELLAWSTLLLPFAKGAENKFQVQREYLGHLFSVILLYAYLVQHGVALAGSSYRWINDNKGALVWAEENKCQSPFSILAGAAVSQFHLLSKLEIMSTTYLPGVQMGEIDAMSRREIHKDIQSVCPSLIPAKSIDLQLPVIQTLFRACDPAAVHTEPRDFHRTFLYIHSILAHILNAFPAV